ncbi:MAG: deoxyribodipyrimidine photolyase, partial [Myxococcales bacterium]|nr:deoxyribodipyrimidine photolyase [Myxococcales bacterium]
MSAVPPARVLAMNDAPARPEGEFVLYWMTAFRRTNWNFSLDRAIAWCRELHRPLVVLEALRCDYPWAGDRLHAFILQGMADNERALGARPVTYYPYVEAERGAGKGLVAALSAKACVVVTDDFPCFMLPRMTASAAKQCRVRMEAVDSNGLLPMRSTPSAFPTAYAFRRYSQRALPGHLVERPRADPFAGEPLPRPKAPPADLVARWPRADPGAWLREIGTLPIDHDVGPVATR